MLTIIKKISIFLLFSFTLTVQAKDDDHDKENLSKDRIAKIIKKVSNLNSKKIDKLLKILEKKFGTDHEGNLRISGVLKSKRFNYSIVKDRKIWYFDASFLPDDTNKIVHIPKLYKTEFFNGGFKIELGYKWIFLFVPTNVDIEQLHGAVYGRGLAMQTGLSKLVGVDFVGVDIGWMPGDNTHGNLFYVAPGVGVFGGVTFPKMKFKINPQIIKN